LNHTPSPHATKLTHDKVLPPVVLDEEKLARIQVLVGREGPEELVRSFLSDLRPRLAAIAAPGAECGTIEPEAHALISLAGNLGLVELSMCSRKLMDACRRREEADLPQCVQELNEAAERARVHLQEWQAEPHRPALTAKARAP